MLLDCIFSQKLFRAGALSIAAMMSGNILAQTATISVNRVPSRHEKLAVRSEAKYWAPPASPEEVTRLPAKFEGVAQNSLVLSLQKTLSKLNKREFETFAEQQSRIDIAKNEYSSQGSAMSFRVKDVRFTYDADAEAFVPNGPFFSYACHRYKNIEKGELSTILCGLDNIVHKIREQTGTNGYGATVEITKIRSRDFGIALQWEDPTFSACFSFPPHETTVFSFRDHIKMERERARMNKGKTISALFVGRPRDLSLLEVTTLVKEATFNDPTQIISQTDALPFRLSYIVFFFYETGEVVGTCKG